MDTFYDIPEVLSHIDPADCDYSEWTQIGMALKAGGFPCSLWDEWSRSDARYHAGECERKWDTFKGGWGASVNIGTIVNMAKKRGWVPEARSRTFDWNDEINDDVKVVDTAYLEDRELVEPSDKTWNPVDDLVTYLETLFDADDYVGYVTKAWKKDDKYMPSAGACDRTAGELIQQLSRCKGDIGSVLGDYNPDVGAWIRFNPLDGKGVKNENVTEYRYALIESDSMELEKQNAIIREMNLPVACLVFSGKKSLHAIVRIDAATYDEYKRRVEFLYGVCAKNGLDLDRQNRNPSRLSRMPGVTRKGRKQFLVDTNIGAASWNEWKDWLEGVNDDLPDITPLESVFDNLPPLEPSLIDGVLRQGHKMLVAGPSKAGKSYALIELAIAIAEGWDWLGFHCAQGRVMYINLELAQASCLHRFADVYKAIGRTPRSLHNLDIWNLRGRAVPMDKLAPKLIRRAQKENYIAVIIDPIYKVITGDENSADQMAAFCNQFDRICTELRSAVIYCHHHSKGMQSNKRSMDRASGSGVFARDPDAMLDMIELNVTESLRQSIRIEKEAEIWKAALDAAGHRDAGKADDGSVKIQEAAKKLLTTAQYAVAESKCLEAADAVKHYTAWRIEGTLREFPRFDSIFTWFQYPKHVIDHSGTLADLRTDDTVIASKAKEKKKSAKTKNAEALDEAFSELSKEGGIVTDETLAEAIGVTSRTIRRWIKNSTVYTINNNEVTLNE